MARRKPNTDFTFSRGWDFWMVNRGRYNNFGYVNNNDYFTDSKKPLLAVIGDSYVEALMVPYRETVQGRLWECFSPDYRVYSFGISGAALSQYLAYTRYVGETFAPSAVAVVVVGNDFDESFRRFRNMPGLHYFEEGSDGGLSTIRVDYSPGERYRFLPGFVENSALLRYVVLNLDLGSAFLKAQPVQEYLGNTSTDVDRQRVALSKKAVDYFLEQMPGAARLEPRNIVLIVDGPRELIYEKGGVEKSAYAFFSVMREYLMRQALARGFTAVDMQPIFARHYEKYGRKFEWPLDGHWNGLSHGLAAKALHETAVVQSVFESKKQCASSFPEE